jgi:large subunit ribosomal protein L32
MPVPRRRHCPARRDRNRTHKVLEAVTHLMVCPNPECGKMRPTHRACPHCGEYKGRFYLRAGSQKASENA